MRLANALEGGLAGVSTLGMIQEAIGHFNPKQGSANLLIKPGIIRKIRKANKKGKSPEKLYIQLAGQIVSGAAYLGFSALGKRKNAPLRGALLGLGAGIATIYLADDGDNLEETDIKKSLMTLASYAAAGWIAGVAVKKLKKKRKK